jgi:hypothetical protein
MSEAEFVEAFWSLAIFVGFVGGLVVLAAIFEGGAKARDTYRRVRSSERARARWAEMLAPDVKDWDSLFAKVRRKQQ